MAAPKNHPKYGGRVKGVPNRSTTELRETFNLIVNNNIDNIQIWLEKCAKDNPGKALDVITRIAELIMPKMPEGNSNLSDRDWYAEQAKKMLSKVV